jgi:hypothetical protein
MKPSRHHPAGEAGAEPHMVRAVLLGLGLAALLGVGVAIII